MLFWHVCPSRIFLVSLCVYISALKTSRLTAHHSEAYKDGVTGLSSPACACLRRQPAAQFRRCALQFLCCILCVLLCSLISHFQFQTVSLSPFLTIIDKATLKILRHVFKTELQVLRLEVEGLCPLRSPFSQHLYSRLSCLSARTAFSQSSVSFAVRV